MYCFALMAGCCLILTSFTYYSHPSDPIKRPKNVIIMIGDGMGLPQLAIMKFRLKTDEPFYLDSFPVTGFQKTHSASHVITDSGAAATAMATGHKSYNNAIGMNADTVPVTNLIELAESQGLATGVVVTSSVTNATPAAFVAHQKFRGFSEGIALDYISQGIDVVIGGGKDHFDRRYADGRHLSKELEANGYHVQSYYGKKFTERMSDSSKRYFFFTSDRDPDQRNQGRDYFPHAVDATLRFLDRKETGFFMMAEGSQIDYAGHRENPLYLVTELNDFHEAIAMAWKFAKEDEETLVIVTADHECGGVKLKEGNPYNHKPIFTFSRNKHSAQMVPVFAYGPGSELFHGIYDNTKIFEKIKILLNL